MILENYNYCASMALLLIGFFGIIISGNLAKKLICLGILQVSVILFYVSLGYVNGAAAPIIQEGITVYVNPVPHVLMLTAIVVGVALMAVALAICVRIKEEYGTIEEDEIFELDSKKYKRESRKK